MNNLQGLVLFLGIYVPAAWLTLAVMRWLRKCDEKRPEP